MERYVIKRRLGAGGAGVVYAAEDRERNTTVALKMLRNLDPSTFYRLKREFRALVDIAHPNLVTLYELAQTGDECFFTMELVDGVGFLDYVRPGYRTVPDPAAPPSGRVADDALQETVRLAPGVGAREPTPPPLELLSTAIDEVRLRDALRQLAQAIHVLHQCGKLHRDIKPSNVLVAHTGRVVLCDFGLVMHVEDSGAGHASRPADHVVGTPAYMSPEQAINLPLTEASDWYAVGVMLYEALTARLPFRGGTHAVLRDKQAREPVPPSSLEQGVPPDLDALCTDLLRHDPEQRPSGAEILRRLGAASSTRVTSYHTRDVPFVGRRAELATLHDAYEAMHSGTAVAVHIHGSPGLGKSGLVRRFLDQVTEDGALTLYGRCYDRESVPYKALDSVVDALSTALQRMPRERSEALMPSDVASLTRLFPVLRRVPAVAESPHRRVGISDPHELQTRGFQAMRDLLARLAALRPLVIALDDLQWSDDDSAALLAEILRPPGAPAMLLIGCYRSDGAGSPLLLERVLGTARSNRDSNVRELALAPLSGDEAHDLALAWLDDAVPARSTTARSIATESGGSPFLVAELARYAEVHRAELSGVRLDDVIRTRVDALDADGREVLSAIAVAGCAIPHAGVRGAVQLAGDYRRTLSILRAERMVNTTGVRDFDRVECYHDRIREHVMASLVPERLRDYHGRLARALEKLDSSEPEMLVEHWIAAGGHDRAASYAERAAAHAMETTAFDRAARLYRLALELKPDRAADTMRPLRIALGQALAHAGRGAEAADVYLEAAEAADRATGLECRTLATNHLLTTGHIERGMALLEGLLAEVGTSLPRTPGAALRALVWNRIKLRLRGLHWTERHPREIADLDLARLDVYQIVADAFAMVDVIRGSDFQVRRLLLALALGESTRVSRALGMEAISRSLAGPRGATAAEPLLTEFLRTAERLRDPLLLTGAASTRAACAYLTGRFVEACDELAESERVLRVQPTRMLSDLTNIRLLRLLALRQSGQFELGVRLLDEYTRDARRRGDVYAETSIVRVGTMFLLGRGFVEEARRGLDETRWSSPERGLHTVHFYEVMARGELALYTADAALARRLLDQFDAYRSALLMRVQVLRTVSRWLEGRLWLLQPDDRSAMPHVARAARRLRREDTIYANTWGLLLEAALAERRGNRARTIAMLRDAIELSERCGMSHCTACARRRLAALVDPQESAALMTESDAWMRREAIADPERLTTSYVPGV